MIDLGYGTHHATTSQAADNQTDDWEMDDFEQTRMEERQGHATASRVEQSAEHSVSRHHEYHTRIGPSRKS